MACMVNRGFSEMNQSAMILLPRIMVTVLLTPAVIASRSLAITGSLSRQPFNGAKLIRWMGQGPSF